MFPLNFRYAPSITLRRAARVAVRAGVGAAPRAAATIVNRSPRRAHVIRTRTRQGRAADTAHEQAPRTRAGIATAAAGRAARGFAQADPL